jgi:cell division protein FtsZ
MMQSTELDGVASLKVVGVGGGGGNAVSRMFKDRIAGVEYIVMNTDTQALLRNDVGLTLRLGEKLTRGLGVGGDPERGRLAAEESRDDLIDVLKEPDMVFIAAGMGGGTGTGAAPVVAEIAKELGALTIGVVTMPFGFEGRPRHLAAEKGAQELKSKVDTLIVIPNDRLFEMSDEDLTMEQAYKLADDILKQGVQSIAEIITTPGEINLDFADVRTVMENAGPAWMAIGRAKGEGRAVEAAREAINSPLLDSRIDGARGVLFNMTGGPDLGVREVYEAAEVIRAAVDPDANIFFGQVTDARMEDEVKITLVATGFQTNGTMDNEDIERLMSNDPYTTRVSDIEIPTFIRNGRRPQNLRNKR